MGKSKEGVKRRSKARRKAKRSQRKSAIQLTSYIEKINSSEESDLESLFSDSPPNKKYKVLAEESDSDIDLPPFVDREPSFHTAESKTEKSEIEKSNKSSKNTTGTSWEDEIISDPLYQSCKQYHKNKIQIEILKRKMKLGRG